jgi:nuclear pore complex protein Nup160
MAVLKISDNKKHALGGSAEASAHQAAQIARTSSRPLTLSELFLRGPGSKARSLLTTNQSDHCSPWYTVLTPLVNISAQLLWPRCAVPAFQQFLLAACQHMQIQEYVRLLSTWCDYYCHSRQFLLGSALLNMAEPEKACDWMIQAVGGVVSDRFLSSQIFSRQELGDEEENVDALTKRLTNLYFLKVIQLFEQFGYYDYVIDLAETAMGVCDEADPDRTTLCYILFSYHLKLGHNDEAYDAMVANPDKSRRKDSLRQFIVTLFDRKQLKKLANYPYINMFEDVELIIESRARSVDLTVNNYYDFLYSFHVMKENYRKAAHVMYECGMRLGTELFTLEGLKRQAKCYLACLNCLKLVSEKNAWIVRPVLNTSEKFCPNVSSSSHLPPGMSPKRSADGEELSMESRIPPKRMEVLEMSEIEREFQPGTKQLKFPFYFRHF